MVKSEVSAISNEDELKKIFDTKGRNNFYDDQDLKTPGHDKIMNYLINDSMLSLINNKLHIMFKDQRGLIRTFICDVNDKWSKKEEFPIKIGYNFRYIDLCATISKKFSYSKNENCRFRNYETYCLNLTPDENRNGKYKYINKDCQYKDNIKECSLYEPDIYNEVKNLKINIEVKTTIPSIGELIRQVNTYRELNDGYYVIITPNVTDSLRNRLNNVNIYVIDTKELGIML